MAKMLITQKIIVYVYYQQTEIAAYEILVPSSQLQKITWEVRKLMEEFLQNMHTISQNGNRPLRLLVWAMVEDILKPLWRMVLKHKQVNML
jgi:hypothetical protein